MEAFEEAYKKAIKENGCDAGRTFARSIFRAGMNEMKHKAEIAYIDSCEYKSNDDCWFPYANIDIPETPTRCTGKNCHRVMDFIKRLTL